MSVRQFPDLLPLFCHSHTTSDVMNVSMSCALIVVPIDAAVISQQVHRSRVRFRLIHQNYRHFVHESMLDMERISWSLSYPKWTRDSAHRDHVATTAGSLAGW